MSQLFILHDLPGTCPLPGSVLGTEGTAMTRTHAPLQAHTGHGESVMRTQPVGSGVAALSRRIQGGLSWSMWAEAWTAVAAGSRVSGRGGGVCGGERVAAVSVGQLGGRSTRARRVVG